MVAFGLCLALFLYFLLLGSAVVRALHASRSRLQDLLISPVVGFGVMLLPVFTLNRIGGMPVITFARWLAPLLAVLAIAAHLLMNRRARQAGGLPAPPADDAFATSGTVAAGPLGVAGGWRPALLAYLPFLAVTVLGLYLTGRPMLSYGFDWLSFCNDDMANYTLAAERFLHYGFLDTPPAERLVRGADYSLTYWFFHVPSMMRAGAEVKIAFVCGVTGLSPHEAFMPLIVAFHGCLIGAAAGLVCTGDDRRTPALVTAALAAMSAGLTFGTVYQLIAQTSGLGILCVNLVLLCRPLAGLTRGQLVRHGLLVGTVLGTQLLCYPEVNPFLAAGFAVYTGIGLARRRLRLKPLIGVLATGAACTIVLLNAYMYDALVFMLSQRGQATFRDDPEKTLFPFFLLPSGLSNFWGFHQIASTPPDGELTVAIVVGALLMLTAVGAMAWLAWQGEPAAATGLVCAVLAVPLFAGTMAFGLYKLAMFSQPFILGSLSIAWVTLLGRWRRPDGWGWPPRWRAWAVPLVLVVTIPGAWRAQRGYVNYSMGAGPTFNEIVGATSTRLLQDIKRVGDAAPPADAARAAAGTQPTMIFDTYNITLSKLLAVYTRGRPAAFPSSRLTGQSLTPIRTLALTRDAYKRAADEVMKETTRHMTLSSFEYEPLNPGSARDRFYSYDQGGRPPGRPDPDDSLVVVSQRTLNLLNRRTFPGTNGPFSVVPVGRVRNLLVFHESELSQPYYSVGDPKHISLYQIEQDPSFYTEGTMAGMGRYFLFEVLRPDEQVRFAVEMTCSLQADGENKLPSQAAAIGVERVPLRFVGRGSGRVFSEPFTPTPVHGRPHVGIDLTQWGKPFVMRRSGAMKLFGTRVKLDRRLLVGFGRDISLIGATDYDNLRPPSAVTKWATPQNKGIGSELRNTDLEYSGLYEDGWMAEQGFLVFGQQPGQTRLVVRGSVPSIDNPSFSTVLTVTVDGQPVPLVGTTGGLAAVNGKMICGDYDVSADVPPTGPSGGRRRVELQWSAVQRLRGEDTRVAATQLVTVGFEAPKPAVAGK